MSDRRMQREAVALDFETFWDSKSGYSLTKMGPIEYVRDDRFEVQTLAIADVGMSSVVGGVRKDGTLWGDQDVQFAIGVTLRNLAASYSQRLPLVAHNMGGFDGLVISERFGYRPKVLYDTITMMHWTGLSRLGSCSHARLCGLLGTGTKAEGTVVSDGKHWPVDFTPEEMDFFASYCLADAEQCLANYRRMVPFLTDDALRFMSLTIRMATDPVFVLDEARLTAFLERIDKEEEDALFSLCDMLRLPRNREATHKMVRSSQQMARIFRMLGVEPPMKESGKQTAAVLRKRDEALFRGDAASAAAWERLAPVMRPDLAKNSPALIDLLEHPDPRIRLLVEARMALNSSVSRSRAERLLKFARQGKPIPVMLSAFKAHTSRYTAGSDDGRTDGLQFQNLSKRDPSKKEIRRAIRAPKGCLVVACDSSQIEARMLAFLADEKELLAQFREGRDPYSELAERIFNVPCAEIHEGAKAGDASLKKMRNVGKTCVLSAGYGVGRDKFSDTLYSQGVRLGGTKAAHDEVAHRAHAVYRDSHPAICRFWRKCDSVIENMAMGYRGIFGGPEGNTLQYGSYEICDTGLWTCGVRLPSEFVIRYHRLECEDNNIERNYYFTQFKGRNAVRTKLYSGLLCNNVTQGMAFQLLMWQACRMDEVGLRLACNIHDSFACVVPESEAETVAEAMRLCMSAVPPWAEGCPIACEAEIGEDFTVV